MGFRRNIVTILNTIVRYFARHAASAGLRSTLYRGLGVPIGKGTFIGGDTWFDCVYVRGMIRVGEHVTISGHSMFVAHDPWKTKPITIGDGTFIGVGTIVLPGVRIGKNAIIGAGAVVTHNIPDNAVAVGVPAVVIKYRSEGDK